MLSHWRERREFRGKAHLSAAAQDKGSWVIVVDAPGHAFEIVPVPADGKEPLVVALGPEASLTGKVIDAETSLPMAGVVVIALPEDKGGWASTGGALAPWMPRTDANGCYRIAGLRPGTYNVMAFAADRVASNAVKATLAVERATTANLTVPGRQWLEFELTGSMPEGPPCRVSLAAWKSFSGGTANFQLAVEEPDPLVLTKAGKVRFGPVGDGRRTLQVFVPSRTRAGTGTTLELGELTPDHPETIALLELGRQLVRGRVALADHVPSERIGVGAYSEQTQGKGGHSVLF